MMWKGAGWTSKWLCAFFFLFSIRIIMSLERTRCARCRHRHRVADFTKCCVKWLSVQKPIQSVYYSPGHCNECHSGRWKVPGLFRQLPLAHHSWPDASRGDLLHARARERLLGSSHSHSHPDPYV